MELAARRRAVALSQSNRNAAARRDRGRDDGPRLAARRRDPDRRPASASARPASPPRSSRSSSSPRASPPPSSRHSMHPEAEPTLRCKNLSTGKKVAARLRRLRAAADRLRPDLRQRRQERRVPAAERVPARALDRASRSPASTCRSTRRSSTSSWPRSSPASAMIYIANRMQAKPNKVQMAVEVAYDIVRKQITSDNLDKKLAVQVVPVPGHALLLHPLLELHRPDPAADEHRAPDRHLRRSRSPPSRSTRRRRTSRSRSSSRSSSGSPTTIEGIRDARPRFGYLKTWLPAGLEDMPGRVQGASSS